MTVQEIVAEYLKNNGYDGLCNEDCGCGLEDFMPCVNSEFHSGNIHGCEPAYRIAYGCYLPSKLPEEAKDEKG